MIRGFRSGVLRLALILACLLVLLALAALLLRSQPFQAAREVLHARAVEAGAFGGGDTSRILQKLDLVHPLPPRILRRQKLPWMTTRELAPASASGVRPSFFSLQPLSRREIPQALLIQRKWLKLGAPVVSLLVNEENLEQLNENPLARGREWERPAFLAYLDEGELEFSSGVGVRLHGGGRRDRRRFRSYRVYFRNDYGLNHFVPEIFPGRDGRPPRQLVIRRDSGRVRGHQWHFHNQLAFDIARRIGVPAPETHSAVFYLNGRPQGVFALTEFLQRDFLDAHFGHHDFVMVRTKQNKNAPQPPVKLGDPAAYEAFLRRVTRTNSLSYQELADWVDLDNLARWFLAVAFCGTRDTWQGLLLRDESVPGSRWFWVAWDMDVSFIVPPEADSFEYLIFGRRWPDPRHRLLRRLLSDSRQFQRLFARLFTDVMNHRVTDAFLAERLRFYQDQALLFDIPDLRFLDDFRAFLEPREAHLRRHLARHLDLGPSHRVQVLAPASDMLEADGFPIGSRYSGWYFDGMTLRLQVRDAYQSDFIRWEVNGRALEGRDPVLELAAEEELRIRAVFPPRYSKPGDDPVPVTPSPDPNAKVTT